VSRVRLGVLGGTFDPVHLGHLRAAESIREAMRLDRVLFIPASVPPHKARPSIASAEERYDMVAAAVRGSPHFSVSRVELDREGPSYTIDTLAEIAAGEPDAELFFIIGIDAFREIQSWKRWEELLRKYSFVVHGRPGYGLAGAYEVVPRDLRSRLVEVGSAPLDESRGRPALFLVSALTLNISSTEIRALLRQGRSIRYLVPAEVEDYIIGRRLYQGEPGQARAYPAGHGGDSRESIETT
jgi:nicotinate-nucleotide adenylyltransferase